MQPSQDPKSEFPELALENKDFFVTGHKNGVVEMVSLVSHRNRGHLQSQTHSSMTPGRHY